MSFYGKLTGLVLSHLIVGSSAVFAQTDDPAPSERPGLDRLVQSSITITEFLDENRDVGEQQAEAIRNFYFIAKDSCVDVVASIAEACEIYQVGTEANVSETATMGRRINVTGTVMMKVRFESRAGGD